MGKIGETAESDAVLLERAAAGDEAAFETLYRRHYSLIHNFCQRRVGDRSVAEELAQDVFVKAFTSLRSARQIDSLRPWLLRVARNLCIDYRRVARPREVDLDSVVSFVFENDSTSDEVIAATGVRRLWEQIYPSLAALDPRDRRLLWERVVEGRSYEELALAEGETKHALRNRAFRVRMTIRERFHAACEELEALSLAPLVTTVRRIKRRVSGRLATLSQSLGDIAVSTLSVGGCVALVVAMSAGGLMESRSVARQPSFASRSIHAGILPATAAKASQPRTELAGEGDRIWLTPVSAHASSTKRPGAAGPNQAHAGIEVRSPDGQTLYYLESNTACIGGDSDVLPATGAVYAYC